MPVVLSLHAFAITRPVLYDITLYHFSHIPTDHLRAFHEPTHQMAKLEHFRIILDQVLLGFELFDIPVWP